MTPIRGEGLLGLMLNVAKYLELEAETLRLCYGKTVPTQETKTKVKEIREQQFDLINNSVSPEAQQFMMATSRDSLEVAATFMIFGPGEVKKASGVPLVEPVN